MKSKTGELSVRSEADGHGSDRIDELDLYEELAAYSQLSPEEQEAYSMRLSEPSLERPEELPSPEAECPEPVIPEAAPTPSPVMSEPVEPFSNKADPVPPRMGTGDLLSAFTSLADSGLTAGSVKSDTNACPSCGCESDSEDMFCVECGAFLDEPAALELPVETGYTSPLAGDT
jgi:hypothetical protein